ncbi:TIGR03826 family flagellar region protein [Paenibacillus aquistagni]|uniref:Flagellar operon protein TIGR03826 n=1 Tax=Paenibacillus aquistagni TaxID=1852522 RepID=A0A1X7KWU2_9BACL|nr:TIGR03826 family flagellar region protein [Paenibacillus aquistagni]NMM54317.1 flagellar protein [Paenibacillus aquistagni]SMG45905.1 flagellar operon protein TIGR03826 [Paenibacillus aquistagni]
MDLANCLRCGRLFAKAFRDICPACIKEIEQEYTRCTDYLRHNRHVTMHELSEATDVSVRQITSFIREGRISIASHENISYKCEACDTNIREGHLCENCRRRLQSDLKNSERVSRSTDESQQGSVTYRITE